MSSDDTIEELEIAEDIIELVPRFLERRGEDLKLLQDGAREGDFGVLQSVGHDIAGTAPSYGFFAMGKVGADLEDAATAKDPSKISDLVLRYEKELERANKAFDAFKSA